MNWKKQLRSLEITQQWDRAIEFMQKVIAANPEDMDAYIYMNFLLMNLLVEEDYDGSKHDYYANLTKHYFTESYAKFANNAKYLFCTGITAIMSEWYFGITPEDTQAILTRAMKLEPDNILYRDTYYLHLNRRIPSQRAEALAYAHLVLQKNSVFTKLPEQLGAFGAYFATITRGWAKRVLAENGETQGEA